MRKWIVVAVVVVVLAGVVAVILQPSVRRRSDSVEYHIRQYREAEGTVTARDTFLGAVRDTWRKMQRRKHYSELVRLGYLDERSFTVTNGRPSDFAAAVRQALGRKGTNYDFVRVAYSTNRVRVTAVKEMMPTPEEILNEMPHPEGRAPSSP